MTITGKVIGCVAAALAGATVEAHDSTSGGTLLGTATTDASGNFTINATGATSGNSIVIVYSKSRFVTATATLTWTSGGVTSTTWKCGATTASSSKTLSAATGYRCCLLGGLGCADPISETLTLTIASTTITLTYNASVSAWVGNTTVVIPKLTAISPACACTFTTTSVAVGWYLDCSGGSLTQVNERANGSNCLTPTDPCYLDATYVGGLTWSGTVPTNSCAMSPTRYNLSPSTLSSTCGPFSFSGTYTAGAPLYPAMSGAFTLTE